MNNFFENSVVEKLKFISFNDEKETISNESEQKLNVTNNKFKKKINSVKNEKIKMSLIELTKVFKEK